MSTTHEKWQTFLLDSSPDTNIVGAGTGAEGIIDLTRQLGHIQVRGSDAQNLLQGQFTADIRNIHTGNSGLAGICNPKGRLLAICRISHDDSNYHLMLPAGLSQPITQRLSMFVLRSDAQVLDVSADTICMGLDGAAIAARLARLLGDLPGDIDQVLRRKGLQLLRIHAQRDRYLLTGPMQAMQPVWLELCGDFPVLSHNHWELTEVRSAVPEVYPGTVGAFVPQMVNLQAVNAISFTKGCYAGQEIIARMQYLGTLKRRMYMARVDMDQLPLPGEDIHSADPAQTQSVGQVVRAAWQDPRSCLLLAVLKISIAEHSELRLGSAHGAKLELQDLPYDLQLQPEA